MVDRKVLGYLRLSKHGMPQDIRIAPDGGVFFVADMHADGVFLVDGDAFKEIGFIATGVGTHGLYPSRDATKLYVANRGSHSVIGRKHGAGSVSVIDIATRKVEATWPIPGGGSPDMGNVTADGKQIWLVGTLGQCRLRDRHVGGRDEDNPGGHRAARPDGLAATGPLLARAHREHALAPRS
jgi:DNA-binding beta-propeller fold protein YncE